MGSGLAMAVVLVAEDDSTERDLISFRLEQSGLQVRAYTSGTAVLEGLDADVVRWSWRSGCRD